MGCISKDTFKRLVVLYLIGKFNDHAVYGRTRFQKVLYFGQKDSDLIPFTFKRTWRGQYSDQVWSVARELTSIGYLKSILLSEDNAWGEGWQLRDANLHEDYAAALKALTPDLKRTIDSSIEMYGYLRHEELIQIAHEDPMLKEVPLGEILVEENLPDIVEGSLSADDCDDLEVALNLKFMESVRKVVDAARRGDFDPDKVKRVVSF